MNDASIVELVWTAVAAIGFAVQAWAVGSALGDLRHLDDAPHPNGIRRSLAWLHIREGLSFLLVHSFFVILGVRALAAPDPPMTPSRAFGIALLMAASIVLVGIGLDARHFRRKVHRQRRHSDPGGSRP